MNQPLISIGMPIYNPGQLLREAIQSILNQTHQNWELLIVDDDSTDRELENIEASGLLNDSRIKIYKNEQNIGLAASLNKCIELAKGEYFARMDQDDISLPNRLEAQLAFLTSHPQVDLLATRVNTINFKGKVVGKLPFAITHEDLCAKPWRSFYMPHPSWMGKMEWFKQHLYKVPQSYYSEDFELLLRSHSTSRFYCLNSVLLHYRIKNKINYVNTLKAYKTIFKLQICYFFKTKKLWFIVLAGTCFLSRLLNISLLFIRQSILQIKQKISRI
ncbi:glycosyltransferase family 2 protein [Methylophilus methylotrophus]|uniref:glycosyltransferase family 2 protein n=1 Tax=Methylophilus methylotrophus TaxID=17 RepID=UPI000686E593|nr:glycosyltransferase [Methylophilus methylotrophus]